MKATITNIIQEGERIRVFVSFDGMEKSFLHPIEATKKDIREAIKAEKERLLDVKKTVEGLESLINEEL